MQVLAGVSDAARNVPTTLSVTYSFPFLNLLSLGDVGTLRAASALVIVLGRSTLRPYHVHRSTLNFQLYSPTLIKRKQSPLTAHRSPLIHLALGAEASFLQSGADGLYVLVVAGFHLELQDAVGNTVGVITTFVVHLHHIAAQ